MLSSKCRSTHAPNTQAMPRPHVPRPPARALPRSPRPSNGPKPPLARPPDRPSAPRRRVPSLLATTPALIAPSTLPAYTPDMAVKADIAETPTPSRPPSSLPTDPHVVQSLPSPRAATARRGHIPTLTRPSHRPTHPAPRPTLIPSPLMHSTAGLAHDHRNRLATPAPMPRRAHRMPPLQPHWPHSTPTHPPR